MGWTTPVLKIPSGAFIPGDPAARAIDHDMGMLDFPSDVNDAFLQAVRVAMADAGPGAVVIFECVCAATQFISEKGWERLDDDDEAAVDADEDDDAADLLLSIPILSVSSTTAESTTMMKSKNARGHWCHTIGLVGKPSSGKSTFFNAATRSTLARVAPHPFTTIEPNVSGGWWAVPESLIPAPWRGTKEGRDRSFIPCVVKDVAGLVPGAGEGRGRGNRFLNDLCDADVLIHVVDSSGLSDSDGNIILADSEGGEPPTDPLHDIQWVREELRAWILGNLMRRFDILRKRPSRLPEMFTGYQAPRWLVDQCLLKAGLNVATAVSAEITESRLGQVVDVFLSTRFPILVALNKCDLPSSRANIDRIVPLLAKNGMTAVPVCAAAETHLQSLVNAGTAAYDFGDSRASLVEPAGAGGADDAEWGRAATVLKSFGSTGVLAALTAAVMLRPPVMCYPFTDLAQMSPAMRSTWCLPLKPGSTVGDAFDLVVGGGGVGGIFVRAEGCGVDDCRADGSRPTAVTAVRKETEVGVNGITVLKVSGTRRGWWQKKTHGEEERPLSLDYPCHELPCHREMKDAPK